MSNIFTRVYTERWQDYELLDVGGGKKLERFGKIILIRPELQAYFKSEWTFSEWSKLAHAEFVEKSKLKGHWKFYKKIDPNWLILIENILVKLSFTNYKHIGIFPEQKRNWEIIKCNLKADDSFLNLFAYTGIASLVAKKQQALVTHVDSVKQLITWSKENMEISKLNGIKWVLEDALKYAKKEVKRGKKYKGIIMDPPAFGLGSKGEKWILEEQISDLLETVSLLLCHDGFLIMNTYSPKVTNNQIKLLSETYFKNRNFEINELWSKSKTDKDLFHGNLLYVGG